MRLVELVEDFGNYRNDSERRDLIEFLDENFDVEGMDEELLITYIELYHKCAVCGEWTLEGDLYDTEGVIDGGIGEVCEQCWEDMR